MSFVSAARAISATASSGWASVACSPSAIASSAPAIRARCAASVLRDVISTTSGIARRAVVLDAELLHVAPALLERDALGVPERRHGVDAAREQPADRGEADRHLLDPLRVAAVVARRSRSRTPGPTAARTRRPCGPPGRAGGRRPAGRSARPAGGRSARRRRRRRRPARAAIARSWMSSTPRSTLPLATSLSESGPEPGLADLQPHAVRRPLGRLVDRRVHRVGREVERDDHGRRRRRGRRARRSRRAARRAPSTSQRIGQDRSLSRCLTTTSGRIAPRSRRVRVTSASIPPPRCPPAGVSGLDARAALPRRPAGRTSPATCSSSTRSTSARAGSRSWGPTRTRSRGRLTAHARARRPVDRPGSCARSPPAEVGDALGLDPQHELTAPVRPGRSTSSAPGSPAELGDSAEALAERLTAMPFFADAGFYKRAQIAANDLHLAGVARFPDIHRLTIFADNLVPHVLRHHGVLRLLRRARRPHRRAASELPAGGRARARDPGLRRARLRGPGARGLGVPPRRSTTGCGTRAR